MWWESSRKSEVRREIASGTSVYAFMVTLCAAGSVWPHINLSCSLWHCCTQRGDVDGCVSVVMTPDRLDTHHITSCRLHASIDWSCHLTHCPWKWNALTCFQKTSSNLRFPISFRLQQRIAYALARSVCVRMLVFDSKSKAVPGWALRVPGGWGSQISIQSAHEGGKVISPTHRQPLPPRKYTWYSLLLGAKSTPGP